MKAGVAMMISAVIRAKKTGLVPAGDVILALLADEEAGSRHGAEFLVTDHAELFHGVRFAVGEFGGFSLALAGRRLYPIQVAEKQTCCLRATLTGPAGHGSLPIRGAVTARLGRSFRHSANRSLPPLPTPASPTSLSACRAPQPPSSTRCCGTPSARTSFEPARPSTLSPITRALTSTEGSFPDIRHKI
jgi:acetylornithine deacetylase/succinyl-diaminopimelate desuccinylase-like protein